MFYRIFILLLKRYKFNSVTTNHRKIVENIVIPQYISLSEQCGTDTKPPNKLSLYQANSLQQPKQLFQRFVLSQREECNGHIFLYSQLLHLLIIALAFFRNIVDRIGQSLLCLLLVNFDVCLTRSRCLAENSQNLQKGVYPVYRMLF